MDPAEKIERLIDEARVAARGAKCRCCNTDDPHRVIGAVTELCRECERTIMNDWIGDSLVQATLASIDRVFREDPKPDALCLVDVQLPRPVTVFGKIAQCSRCDTKPLSEQEIQGGWLCQACANGSTAAAKAPTSTETPCSHPLPWYMTTTGYRCERCDVVTLVGGGPMTAEQVAAAIGEVPQHVALSAHGMCAGPNPATGETSIHFFDTGASVCRCGERSRDLDLEVPPRRAMTQSVPVAWEWKHPGGAVAVASPPATTAGFAAGGSFEVPVPSLKAITLEDEGGLRIEEIGYDGPGGYARRLGCTCRDFHNARSEDGVLEAQHDAKCALRNWRIRARRGDLQVLGRAGMLSPDSYTRMVYGHETAERLRERNNALAINAAAARAVDPLSPPPRPDGFSQSAVDAAKAVLLAPAKKRGGR